MPHTAYERLRRAQRHSPNPTADERTDWLERLERLLVTHKQAFVSAIDADFGGRSSHETLLADVLLTLDTVRSAKRSVESWMESTPVRPSKYFLPSRAMIETMPKGVVGIISPWNYPVNLAFAPLAAALAAGNRVLLKPSELTPRTSELIARTVRETFTAEEVVVLEGDAEVAKQLCALPLDHLFFTGSTAVGKMVAAAAAVNLTPVTLELGGKSPALVHADYPIAKAAARIAVGKMFNAGQTCIAPDYVLIADGRESEFVSAFRAAAKAAYPRLDGGQYSSVVSDRHLARLEGLLADAQSQGARVEPVFPDEKVQGRRMPPVLVLGATSEMKLMQEEIFGPILPIRTHKNLDGAIDEINGRPRPLSFYYFDEDLDRATGVLSRTISGGACLNDTLVHFAQEDLPFGGVGASGMGAYHGRAGYDVFSHTRGVLIASAMSPARQLQSPPYGRVLDTALEVLIGGAGFLRSKLLR